ncbi:MAG: LytTR family DNA-binding domain-containing protein [Prevotellaceae bacterium]|nr:LytTR family DNA-binding domain-containing protein [Prevotellaceae bacterium]
MILNCAIIDDEPLAADLLASYVAKTPELNLIGTFESALTAMKVLRDNPADLLFLDIQMPELSGLEFAKILPKETKVIFTTAFDRYAIEGYKVNAIDYLLKPISYDKFVVSVNKAMEWFSVANKQKIMSQDRFIFVKSEYKLVPIKFDDILYIEGLKDYIKIYLSTEKRSVMSLMNMKKMEDYLPRPQFMRVHRSFIINMSKVDLIDRGRMVIGETFIPISESYKDVVQNYIDSHTLQ